MLLAVVACDEALPKSIAPAPRASSDSATNVARATSAATSVGDSVKLDVPPAPVAPEQRLRQRQLGNRLVIDTAGTWAPDCAIHRPCRTAVRALSACAPNRDAEAWGATLASKAERFTDPQVAIKGKLVMSDGAFSTAVGCAKNQCCNRLRARIVLEGPPYDLELVGLGCAGDESRLCCALSARGEEVIASGRLSYQTGQLLLHSPELCRTKTD
jgi:hypothetical protein